MASTTKETADAYNNKWVKRDFRQFRNLNKQLQAENKQQTDLLALAKEEMDAQAIENKRLKEALAYIELHANNNLIQGAARKALKGK